jgi:hypothetical protein
VTELARNLNGRTMSRRYDRLDGAERFRLAIEAAARGDELERGRLRDAAPMPKYRITDPEYRDRVDASYQLAVTFALFALPASAELRGWLRCAYKLLDEGTPVDAVPVDVLARVADVMACYAGFARVCRAEMELEPEVVLRAHLAPVVDIAEVEKLATAIDDVDPDVVDRGADVFRQGWEHLT